MHGTRTTVRILAGVAMAALSGCVAVEPPSPAPPAVPSPADARPGHAVAPQIVQGPAREALEAAMPDPTPEPRSSVERRRDSGGASGGGSGGRSGTDGTSGRNGEAAPRATARPRPGGGHGPEVDLPGLLKKPPRSAAEICELGARYGGWSPDSEQARICRGTYGR
ncbi:hypothetical protein [Streptomyces sp. NPDC048659]|uniref:hypothetical protein n=1 Tax=Streptomyces sp. NPDC048659 TaxID=3155489 RepID=UPI00341FE947